MFSSEAELLEAWDGRWLVTVEAGVAEEPRYGLDLGCVCHYSSRFKTFGFIVGACVLVSRS